MVKNREDLCPFCGKGKINREPAPIDIDKVCEVCHVELRVPGDVNKPVVMYTARSGSGPWEPTFAPT